MEIRLPRHVNDFISIFIENWTNVELISIRNINESYSIFCNKNNIIHGKRYSIPRLHEFIIDYCKHNNILVENCSFKVNNVLTNGFKFSLIPEKFKLDEVFELPRWMEKYMKDYILPCASSKIGFTKDTLKSEIEKIYNDFDNRLNPYNVMVVERIDLLIKLKKANIIS